jgi:hypothetical protein
LNYFVKKQEKLIVEATVRKFRTVQKEGDTNAAPKKTSQKLSLAADRFA